MPKVMIIDDDRMMVGLLGTLLELDGFEVKTVPDFESARSTAPVYLPDAFLIDYNLKGVDGTQVVAWIRAQHQFARTPIVMSSGMSREVEALDAGANVFLEKPFDPAVLVDILREMLGIV